MLNVSLVFLPNIKVYIGNGLYAYWVRFTCKTSHPKLG